MVSKMFKKTNPNQDKFDQIIVGRLLSSDFAQPQPKDLAFYKLKSVAQIESALKAISEATNQHDFSTAITQAIAFVNASYDFEFIDSTERAHWLIEINHATRTQLVEEYA